MKIMEKEIREVGGKVEWQEQSFQRIKSEDSGKLCLYLHEASFHTWWNINIVIDIVSPFSPNIFRHYPINHIYLNIIHDPFML